MMHGAHNVKLKYLYFEGTYGNTETKISAELRNVDLKWMSVKWQTLQEYVTVQQKTLYSD